MKILLAPVGTEGDVRPLLAIGKVLFEKGNNVSVCSSTDYIEISRKYGFKFHSIDLNFKEIVSRNRDVAGTTLLSALRFIRNLRDAIDKQFAGLPPFIKNHDLIIGSGLQLGAFSIAEHYQKKYNHIVFAPNWLPSAYHTPPQASRQFRSKVVNKFLWYFFKGIINLSVTKKINVYRIEKNLKPVTDIFKSIRNKTLISHSSSLTKIPEDCSDVRKLSYLVRDTDKFPGNVVKFIKNGSPPVYIGFGSMPGNQRTIKLFMGVIADLNLRAIIQKGWAGFKTTAEERFLEVDEVSHVRLFPKMAVIVHHGGAGTTFCAAEAGVPQLVIPHFLDQFYWADRITKLGVGTQIKLKNISRKRIRGAIVKILNNSRYHKKAKELGENVASEKLKRSFYEC